jgi:Na+-driven multidrug efflux pump
MLPVGIMSACTTLIGNSVGEGRKDKALSYYRTSLILATILAAIQVVLLLAGVDGIMILFTNNSDISDLMWEAWPVLQVFVIFDTLQGVSAAVVRGSG